MGYINSLFSLWRLNVQISFLFPGACTVHINPVFYSLACVLTNTIFISWHAYVQTNTLPVPTCVYINPSFLSPACPYKLPLYPLVRVCTNSLNLFPRTCTNPSPVGGVADTSITWSRDGWCRAVSNDQAYRMGAVICLPERAKEIHPCQWRNES